MSKIGIQQVIPKYHYKQKPTAHIDQAPPVQNTWYTVLDTTEDVLLLTCYISQTNTEIDAKNFEVRWIGDGITFTGGDSLANATDCWANEAYGSLNELEVATDTYRIAGYYCPLPFQSLKIDVRITSAAGTAQHLYCSVNYFTLEAT